MGFLDVLSGIPIVGPVISGLSGHAQAEAQEATAGFQANVSKAQIESEERIFKETIALDRDKFDFLKEQSAGQAEAVRELSLEQLEFETEKFEYGKEVYASELEFRKTQAKVTPTSQVGTISYPYVSVKTEKAKPSPSILLLVVGAGAVYFFILRR